MVRPMTETSPGAVPPPADQRARDRVETDLRSTLFVEAGAGSGKTTALVGRVVALVTRGEAQLSEIAAITFTEKAAAELRYRLRQELGSVVARQHSSPAGRHCRLAIDQLDSAAIGTLHSFARRILTEYPIEAGLPPRVEVLDEVSSNVAFEERWSAYQDELLADTDASRTLLLFFGAGVRPAALRYLARAFDDNWDLVQQRVEPEAGPPPDVHQLFAALLPTVQELLDEPCAEPDDKLRERVQQVGQRLQDIGQLTDELELLESLGPDATPALPSFSAGRIGKAKNWADIGDIRERLGRLGRDVSKVREDAAQACALHVAACIRRFTLAAAEQRRTTGQLQFHDLLVLARSLLRHPEHGPAVRSRLHKRYRHLLLDEFQDTDPIQVELAVLIAAADPGAATTADRPWDEVDVTAGHLFMVGDPKQSIYRFRRADISVFMQAAERFGGPDRVELTANFRSGEPIINWVNTVFGALMGCGDVAGGAPSQPRFIPLSPTRPASPAGPPVSVIGRHEHAKGCSADDMRLAEAADVAAAVAGIIQGRWQVDNACGGWRDTRLGDIAVLVPARTSLPFLEDALDRAGIAFRTESSSLVYAGRAVRDLLMVLRSVADPTNYLYTVSALRTPLLGCGDDDLFRFARQHDGRWSYLADQPSGVPAGDPVLKGLLYLRSLYEERAWLAPSELLERVARDRRAFELGFAGGRARDVWRQLRFVIDQARAWGDATGGNLRQYLSWVGAQVAESGRVTEPVLPETDDDAVRVMTIHAAKGLEFPVTVISGMSTAPHHQFAPAEVVFPPNGKVGYHFGSRVKTEEYDAWKPIDEQMSFHERQRLLYVACTRARDHLVVSVHRKQRTGDRTHQRSTNAELLVEGMGASLAELPDAAGAGAQLHAVAARPVSAPPPYEEWLAGLRSSLGAASRQRTIAATALTEEGDLDPEAEPDPGLQKRPRDLDLPPWVKGRYGSAIGRAVHGALQTVDLGGDEGLDAIVAAQCQAEAVPERSDLVRRLVLTALNAAPVRQAVVSPHWREVYVCAGIEGRLLEGYIDLLYRTPDGLVIVDYKTAGTSAPEDLEARAVSYGNQGASYALALEAATGQKVARVVFLFLTPQGAVERDIRDLTAAMGHVRQLLAAGQELLVEELS